MRSIAIINQKGGAGKTTTAVNVADGLARHGHRVLLVDLDAQSHASLHVGVQVDDDDRTIFDVLAGSGTLQEAARPVRDGLVLVPASLDLVAAEGDLRDREDREEVLARAFVTVDGEYDYCIVDCPPSLGLLTINALAAVDEVVIPLQPHFLALQGLSRLLETVMLVRGVLNDRLRVSGVVLCMFERGTRLAQEVLDDICRFLDTANPEDAWYRARVFDAKIRRNIKLAECPSFGQTIYDYAPSSHGAEDYAALTEEIRRATRPIATSRPTDDVVTLPEQRGDVPLPERDDADAPATRPPS
jgi:chromosome partitioning protein